MLSLYIKSNKTYEQIVSALEDIFCMTLEMQQTDMGLRCQFYCLDVEFYLISDHGMEDDLGIEFTKYDYSLEFIKLNRGGYSEEYNTMYTSIVNYYTNKISDSLCANTMLVEDSQRILSQKNS